MLSLLVLFNKTIQTYFQSLKKDLGRLGFDPTLLVVAISWANTPLIILMILFGKFNLPSDPYFYFFWFILTLLATSGYILFINGILRARFVAGNSLGELGFVMTALYSVVILHEHLTQTQVFAIILALLGALLFFEWKNMHKEEIFHNKGLLLILFSIVLHPLNLIFYKLAIAHTNSYFQFLSGRFLMDLVYDSIFFFIVVYYIRHMNVKNEVHKFFFSTIGVIFAIGTALANLLDSWLIYKLPVSTFALLGTISIPIGYIIAKVKYKETIGVRYLIGGVLIIVAVFIFVL
jgi:drug/metabolite transporter (DMT)-like permease